MNERGKLIVISGPSGAGKSTVVFKAIEGRSDVCFSTSVTTRKPRPGEVDGKEYFFVDLDRADWHTAFSRYVGAGNFPLFEQGGNINFCSCLRLPFANSLL